MPGVRRECPAFKGAAKPTSVISRLSRDSRLVRDVSSFSFVHAADLHLGSPLTGLALRDPEIARRFGEATRTALSTLVSRTIEAEAAFMVIAGDVYDGEWRDNSVGLFFAREMARLERAGIPVFILRGNHDAESVVTRAVTLPDNVTSFGTRRPETHTLDDLRVALHGQSFPDRQVGENLAAAYPAPVPGHFNIGVLHTSLTGRPPHADYAPCSLADLAARGYSYWALGHVHAFEVVSEDPPVVFPGNIQGRSIRETGEKGAVLVTVTDGEVSGIERMIVDEARWARVEIAAGGADDLAGLVAMAREALRPHVAAAEGRPLALRLRLSGESPLYGWALANRALLIDEMQNACHQADAEAWLEKLELDLAPPAEARPLVPLDASLDLAALLGEAANDPHFREEVDAQIGLLVNKLPAGLVDPAAPFGEELDTLVAEARALLAERIAEGS